MRKIKFTQDAGNKLTVEIPENMVESLIKNITGWRTPTKKYKSIRERFSRCGTSTHDYVIEKLFEIYGDKK